MPSAVSVPPLPGGPGGGYIYALDDGRNDLIGVSLVINVTQDIVSSSSTGSEPGFSFN